MRFFSTFVVFLFCFLFLSITKVCALDNFYTSYDANYNVSENGTTQVLFNISLTNKTENYYASSYKIRTGFDDAQNINAFDAGGSLYTTTSSTDQGKEIKVVFNKKVLGAGSILSFNLSFSTNNIAYKQGNIWEVNIPGVSNQNDFEKFNAHVKVPQSFGDPEYIKPDVNLSGLNFTKEQLGNSGISIAFGKKQIYDFTLTYHLTNDKIYPVATEIALPPSTNYQDVYIENISPKPSNVTLDNDGNWLAQYSLLPTKKLDVVVKGKALLFLRPRKQVLSAKDFEAYLLPEKYWEASEKIKNLANSLKTPKAIYEYVAKTLTYDFSRTTDNKPRLGAKNVLENPKSAVCLEFTDLFIALSRAAGIPAREVDGYAYTKNERERPVSLIQDILHAWPEYYDKDLETWVMIDPTWENTTKGVDYFNILDFDHFAFVIRGQNSSYPIPAGGYKIPASKNTKDVSVDFAKNFIEKTPTLTITTSIPDTALSGLPIQGEITLKNVGQTIYPQSQIKIESDFLSLQSGKKDLDVIPPYGTIKIPVSFEQTPFLTNREALVKITLDQNYFSKTVKITPFIVNRITIALGGILLATIITIILLIVTRGSRHLPFFRKKKPDPLRGESQEPQETG
ncbi:MAG: transglutaminase-like domain-containing protein [Candidatus Levyibacteriota bacterium]